VLEGALIPHIRLESCLTGWQGYLDVVRWLCESGGAAAVTETTAGSVRGVDRKASSGGWTPLMVCMNQTHCAFLTKKDGSECRLERPSSCRSVLIEQAGSRPSRPVRSHLQWLMD